MQNAGIAKLGLDWRYLAFDVRPEDLRSALQGAKAMRFIGLNLTVPHKLLAIQMVDALDDSAKTWGAVNTVRFEGLDAEGSWRPLQEFQDALPDKIRSQGFNTDAEAIAESLRTDLEVRLHGARVLLLGAGGAGRVAALKLAQEQVRELFLVNRTVARAEAAAADVRQRFPGTAVHIGYPRGEIDLVINATSIGLAAGDPLPFDASQFSIRQSRAAYDMIYRPAETLFLRGAREAGSRVANGLGMLLHQGARALEIWSGQTAPVAIMRQALHKNVYGS